jgi:transcriptional regulator with XRE-family HTH domain
VNLGLAIENCRKLRGITKSKLAERADLSLSYLSLIIKGDREPTIGKLDDIASALGVPSSILLFLASNDDELPSMPDEVKNELRKVAVRLIQAEAEKDNPLIPS